MLASAAGPAGVDLDDDAARLFQGAPDAGLQAELHHRIEQEAAPDPRLYPGGHLPGGLALPEGSELVAFDGVRRDEPVAAEGIVAGSGDGLADERVQRDRVLSDSMAQHRAQGQRVGAALDEPGPVRGVLDAVGEDKRLLLPGIKIFVAEEGGQGDREQGGDGAAEEADAVLLLA